MDGDCDEQYFACICHNTQTSHSAWILNHIVLLFSYNFYWISNIFLSDCDEQDFACICYYTQTSHSAAFPGDANGAAITKTLHFHPTKIKFANFYGQRQRRRKRQKDKDKCT